MSQGTKNTLEASKTTQHITAKFFGHGCIFQNNIKIFSNYGNGVSDISIFESVAKNYIELQKDDTSSKYTKKTANSVNYLKSLNL